jgi:uncharacterized RDD family membrane protein YckC
MRYVSIARRGVAIVIDAIVFFVLAIPISIVTGSVEVGSRTTTTGTTKGVSFRLGPGGVLLTALLWLVYMTLAESRGATLGKLATGIRVVKEDGTPMEFGAALIRNLLRLVDGQLLYLVGILFAISSPKKQRLGDRVAHTVVVPAESLKPGLHPLQMTGQPPVPPPPPQ